MHYAGLFSSLSYFFAENGRHSNDYQLALQRFAKCEGANMMSYDLIICKKIVFNS